MMPRWVPLDKRLVRALPNNRPYTELEAVFCVSVDYDNGATVTVRGYAAQWKWSQGKVRRFLDAVGVEIQYPEDTADRQNQRGAIMIQTPERLQSDPGAITAIDSRWLSGETERPRSDNGEKPERSQIPTKKPNPKPITSSSFSTFWSAYPNKVGKAAAEKAWKRINADESLVDDILTALAWQRECDAWTRDDRKYIPHPATWLNGERWTDERPQPAKIIPMDRHQSNELNLIGEEIPA